MTDLITLIYNNGKLVLYLGGNIMDSIGILKLLDPQLPWELQVVPLVIFILHLPPTMVQKISSQLLQISAFNRILFANAV